MHECNAFFLAKKALRIYKNWGLNHADHFLRFRWRFLKVSESLLCCLTFLGILWGWWFRISLWFFLASKMGKPPPSFPTVFWSVASAGEPKKNLAIIASPQLTQPKGHESLNYIFPTKYGIPKSLKVSHWLSESNTHPISLGKAASSIWNSLSLGGLRWKKNTATAE